MKYLIIILILLSLALWFKPDKKVEPLPIDTPLPLGSILPPDLPAPSQEEIMTF